MKTMRVVIGIVVVFVVLFSFAGCKMFFNKPPSVSLSYTPETPELGEDIFLTANASDPDGDSLSYTWRIDGVNQNVSAREVSWAPEESGTYEIQVTVSDGEESASDSVSITVEGSTSNENTATLVIKNQSSYDIWYFYMSYAGTDQWSEDLLGDDILYSGYNFTISNIPVGSFDLLARSSSYYNYVWTEYYFSMEAGKTYTWTLYD